MQYTDIFWKQKFKISLDFFSIFLLKTYTVYTCQNRLGNAVLTSTDNLCFGAKDKKKKNRYTLGNPDKAVLRSTHKLCFGAKIRKIGMPCKPQFLYIKVGFKGIYFSWTCYPDA